MSPIGLGKNMILSDSLTAASPSILATDQLTGPIVKRSKTPMP